MEFLRLLLLVCLHAYIVCVDVYGSSCVCVYVSNAVLTLLDALTYCFLLFQANGYVLPIFFFARGSANAIALLSLMTQLHSHSSSCPAYSLENKRSWQNGLPIA